MPAESRWPPVYDFDELMRQIGDIVGSNDIAARMYAAATRATDGFFQGDIVLLDADIPFIGPQGAVDVQDPPEFWAIIGNTCDLDKPVEEKAFTQMVPVWDLGEPEELSTDLRRYRYFTQFHFPAWNRASEEKALVADFLRPVAVHKGALQKAAVVARLSYVGWVLFHSCLVRFLARGDGRND